MCRGNTQLKLGTQQQLEPNVLHIHTILFLIMSEETKRNVGNSKLDLEPQIFGMEAQYFSYVPPSPLNLLRN
jgi:hypothetical protein